MQKQVLAIKKPSEESLRKLQIKYIYLEQVGPL